jgi:hypothetical protein
MGSDAVFSELLLFVVAEVAVEIHRSVKTGSCTIDDLFDSPPHTPAINSIRVLNDYPEEPNFSPVVRGNSGNEVRECYL